MEKTVRALAEVHPDLVRGLNINAVIPYLNQHDLVTRQEYEILLNDVITTDEKINKLVSWLPTKGPKALEHFITCLNESGSGTGHKILARKVERAAIAADAKTYILNHAIDSLDTRDQIIVLNYAADKIIELLDLSTVLPSLHLHHLITDEENDSFSDPQISKEIKMKELIMILPGKGSKFLSRFVICLRETTEGTKHQELVTKILFGAKLRKAFSKIEGFFKSICRCLCKCVCLCCTSISFILLLIITIFAVGRLMSYGVSMDKPDMIPFSELPKSYSKVLPRLRNIFVGRKNETYQLLEYLSFNNSNVRIVGIFGGPGFGKSTLAIQASHRLVVSTNISIEYYDLSEVSFIPYLLHRILGTSTNITEHTVMLEELKKWADKVVTDTILLFDGCDVLLSGSQKVELQNVIKILVKHSDHIKILLTSRYVVSFFDFKSVVLDELKAKDATALLKRLTTGTSETVLQKIAASVGNVPLALQVVGALLETKIMTPEKMVFELSQNPIETLSPIELPPDNQIGTSLQLSYSSLDEFTQRCGWYLANFPGSFNEDAAFRVIAYMIDKTYWYSKHLQEYNLFLHWLPRPSTCFNTLAHHSLLKFNPTLQRYSFHKLIRDFFLHSLAEENEVEEKHVFRIGFSLYFVKYWDSFHNSVDNHNYDSNILAALDLERHNFELMEIFLPEFGEDISYIKTYIVHAEILVADNLQPRINYFQHLRSEISPSELEEFKNGLRNRLENCKALILLLDFHSKFAVKEKGPWRYMEIFVKLMLQKSASEEYLFSAQRALESLKSRRHRVMEIYEEHGNTILHSICRYYQGILRYSLDTGDIDIYMEAIQRFIMLKSEAITLLLGEEGSEQRKGLIEFGAENYKKAKQHYKQYLRQRLSKSEYLYTMMLVYYSCLFNGDEERAIKVVQLLDSDKNHLRVRKLVVDSFNYQKVGVLSKFYAKVRPGSLNYDIITLKLRFFPGPTIS